nr:hypothetical protein TCT1_36310 [Xenorhabdus sp. TCT-1]
MNFTHHPSYNQSEYLKNFTQEKLLSSLEYVLYVCDDVLDKNIISEVVDFISKARKKRYSSGFLFYIIKEIGKAIENQSVHRIHQCFNLIPLLNITPATKVIVGNKENLPTGMFDFYSKINDDVYGFEYVDIEIENESLIQDSLNEAFKIIFDIDSELYREIIKIVDEFFIFRTHKRDNNIVYSGSDFNKLGTVFINEEICKSDNIYFLVDKIIHESAHQVLLSIMTLDEIVLNDDRERYPSPLRTGLRTMNGIYHAAFVLYRISCFFNKLVKSDPSDTKAIINLEQNVRQFKDCYGVISNKGALTNAGKNIIDACNSEIEAILDGIY